MNGIDPRPDVSRHLYKDIPKDACVLVYNQTFEKTRLKELANFLNCNPTDTQRVDDQTVTNAEIAAHLMNIRDNIKDLMVPFQSRAYYSRELSGSYSIKDVLPVLCPDAPALDYSKLDLVHNGTEAMDIYRKSGSGITDEDKRIVIALLEYCKLDTLAMVKILGKLRGLL